MTINPTLMKVSYDALKDLTAVAQVASLPQIMVASKSLGVTSVKELVAQNKGKKLAYGTPGTGTIQHLTMVEFRKASTLDLTHAPYRGGAQVMADLLGGHLPLGMLTVPSVASSVKAGTVVALGVLSKNRVPLLPDVPTLAEQGFPQFTQDIWVGFFAPSATPKALVETMSRALQKAASSSDFETAMKEVGGPVTLGGSAEFGKMVRDDFSFWAKVVKDSGVRPDQ